MVGAVLRVRCAAGNRRCPGRLHRELQSETNDSPGLPGAGQAGEQSRVDCDKVADRYQQGRRISETVLDRLALLAFTRR
jgi:hypothetical protein